MSNKKFTLLAFLIILVFIPLLVIDWAMIVHVISHVIHLGGIELYAVSGLFIFAITVLPVVGVSPALTERINENRYCRWTNRPVENGGNAFIGLANLIFLAFSTAFLVMSVTNPDRFIIGQGDPILEMFPAAVSGLIVGMAERGTENATIASWITGLLPLSTTLISFAVYVLICMDKKEERLGRDIQVCQKKIEQFSAEITAIQKDIESSGSEVVLLDNLSDYIGEIERNISEFVAEKENHLQRAKEEQRYEFELAQRAVEKQCWTDFNEFYERGKRKFEQIRKGNPEMWKVLMGKWNDFCQEMRDKIAIEMSNDAGNPDESYAAMVISPLQQNKKRRV